MKFKFAVSKPDDSAFSLKKEDSDFTSNQIVLNAVIGTLVKYGHSGEIEPYLSESWSASSDKKVWIFKFKVGLLAENGIESLKGIDNLFINNFNQILYEDAVIIPIQHLSSKWFVTNDIDPMSLPKTVIYPQFELIRTKK